MVQTFRVNTVMRDLRSSRISVNMTTVARRMAVNSLCQYAYRANALIGFSQTCIVFANNIEYIRYIRTCRRSYVLRVKHKVTYYRFYW